MSHLKPLFESENDFNEFKYNKSHQSVQSDKFMSHLYKMNEVQWEYVVECNDEFLSEVIMPFEYNQGNIDYFNEKCNLLTKMLITYIEMNKQPVNYGVFDKFAYSLSKVTKQKFEIGGYFDDKSKVSFNQKYHDLFAQACFNYELDDEKGNGFGLSYRSDKVKGDIYVYDLNHKGLFTGTDSPLVALEMFRVLDEIVYSKIHHLNESVSGLSPVYKMSNEYGDRKLDVFYAWINSDSPNDVGSLLILTCVNGYYFKIRVTAISPNENSKNYMITFVNKVIEHVSFYAKEESVPLPQVSDRNDRKIFVDSRSYVEKNNECYAWVLDSLNQTATYDGREYNMLWTLRSYTASKTTSDIVQLIYYSDGTVDLCLSDDSTYSEYNSEDEKIANSRKKYSQHYTTEFNLTNPTSFIPLILDFQPIALNRKQIIPKE